MIVLFIHNKQIAILPHNIILVYEKLVTRSVIGAASARQKVRLDMMKSPTETAIGVALKSAVQNLSKKKQTEMIAQHVYSKFEVFRQFRPLALGIHEHLIAALPQFDPTLVSRTVANHCRKPRYIKALARGGHRFDLQCKHAGHVSPEEQKGAEELFATYTANTLARTNRTGTTKDA